jgi:hypothetical protein
VRLEGIQIGDIVDVDQLGRRFNALVALRSRGANIAGASPIAEAHAERRERVRCVWLCAWRATVDE